MKRASEKHFFCLIILFIIILQVIFLCLNTGTYGGADNVTHYQIAKYAFKYPELFLDHWGKPVYTTLLAPLTIFGFKAAKAFNLLVAIFTLLITANLSRRLYPGSSVFTITMISFSPVYFFLMLTCLTEVLFSLFLVISIYLFWENRLIPAAIVLSFIVFIRTEGIVLFPVFALGFILKRSSRSIIFLFTGTVFYTVIGYFVFDDILWLIHQFPYSTGESVYGSGSILHFIKKSNYIFGIPFLVVLVTGLFYWVYAIIRNLSLKNEDVILFILITGSWVTYFIAHSYAWWKGAGSSLGLIRVMGGIIPLAALTGVKAIEFIYKKFTNWYIASAIVLLIMVLQVSWLFIQNDFPIKADTTDQLIAKSAEYIEYNEPGSKVFYFNPLLIHCLEIDPYNTNRCNWGIADKQQPSNSMEWGDIIVWDAHFGPNEGGVQLEVLERDPFLKKIKSFYPLQKVTVLGGYEYSVQIFKKSSQKNLAKKATNEKLERILSFENYPDEKVIEVDGEKVLRLEAKHEYSPGITLSPNEIIRNEFFEFNVSVTYKGLEELLEDEVLLIFSIEDKKQNLRYEKASLISSNDEWKNVRIDVRVPADLPESSVIKVYVWNKDKKRVDLKKISVTAISL